MRIIRGIVEMSRRSRPSTWVGGAIVVVALVARGIVCFTNVDQFLATDVDDYRAIAETLNNTGVYGFTHATGPTPTARRPPLYPIVLSFLVVDGVVSPYLVAALHTLLGAVTVFCVYRAARQMLGETSSHRASILAALLVLVDPILLRQSTLVMTETLAAALVSIILWWWARHAAWTTSVGKAVTLGALLSLAFFCRPTFLVWGMLFCVCVAFTEPHHFSEFKERVWRAVLVGVTVLLPIGYWMIRNYQEIGYPVWATTHGGYTLLLGNNPLFYDYLRNGDSGTTWDFGPFERAYMHRYDPGADPKSEEFWKRDWNDVRDAANTQASASAATEPAAVVSVTEPDDDQLDYEIAWATTARDPAMFRWSCLIRVFRLWEPFPGAVEGRSSNVILAIGIYYVALYVAIAYGIWKLGRELLIPLWWPIPALVLTLTVVHLLYWSNMRMRAPAIPAIAIIAAAAIRRPEDSAL